MIFSYTGQIDCLKRILKDDFEWNVSKIEKYFTYSVEVDGTKYEISNIEYSNRIAVIVKLLTDRYEISCSAYYNVENETFTTNTESFKLTPKDGNGAIRYIDR